MAVGTLYIISAASGTGKTSLVIAVLQSQKNIDISISHTTRPQRPGEQDGTHYHFVDAQTFLQMRDNGEFLEHAHVFDHYYGTTAASVQSLLDQGKDVILEIDWQGARQVKPLFPHCISIFILPPSKESLEARLRQRGQDDELVITRRMQDAVSEMSHYHEFDYLIINDIFEAACRDLTQIFNTNRLAQHKQSCTHQHLIEDLFIEDIS